MVDYQEAIEIVNELADLRSNFSLDLKSRDFVYLTSYLFVGNHEVLHLWKDVRSIDSISAGLGDLHVKFNLVRHELIVVQASLHSNLVADVDEYPLVSLEHLVFLLLELKLERNTIFCCPA